MAWVSDALRPGIYPADGIRQELVKGIMYRMHYIDCPACGRDEVIHKNLSDVRAAFGSKEWCWQCNTEFTYKWSKV